MRDYLVEADAESLSVETPYSGQSWTASYLKHLGDTIQWLETNAMNIAPMAETSKELADILQNFTNELKPIVTQVQQFMASMENVNAQNAGLNTAPSAQATSQTATPTPRQPLAKLATQRAPALAASLTYLSRYLKDLHEALNTPATGGLEQSVWTELGWVVFSTMGDLRGPVEAVVDAIEKPDGIAEALVESLVDIDSRLFEHYAGMELCEGVNDECDLNTATWNTGWVISESFPFAEELDDRSDAPLHRKRRGLSKKEIAKRGQAGGRENCPNFSNEKGLGRNRRGVSEAEATDLIQQTPDSKAPQMLNVPKEDNPEKAWDPSGQVFAFAVRLSPPDNYPMRLSKPGVDTLQKAVDYVDRTYNGKWTDVADIDGNVITKDQYDYQRSQGQPSGKISGVDEAVLASPAGATQGTEKCVCPNCGTTTPSQGGVCGDCPNCKAKMATAKLEGMDESEGLTKANILFLMGGIDRDTFFVQKVSPGVYKLTYDKMTPGLQRAIHYGLADAFDLEFPKSVMSNSVLIRAKRRGRTEAKLESTVDIIMCRLGLAGL